LRATLARIWSTAAHANSVNDCRRETFSTSVSMPVGEHRRRSATLLLDRLSNRACVIDLHLIISISTGGDQMGTATKIPQVEELADGSFAIEIAPKCWVKWRAQGEQFFVRIETPPDIDIVPASLEAGLAVICVKQEAPR
jgi:hypothetical protein